MDVFHNNVQCDLPYPSIFQLFVSILPYVGCSKYEIFVLPGTAPFATIVLECAHGKDLEKLH